MNFRPETMVCRVLLKPHIEKETKGGIIISRSERNQAINTDKGTILAFGPQAWKDFGCDTAPYKVGDKVYYSHFGAKVIQDEDNKDDFFVLCNDEDILVGYNEDE